MNSLALSLHWLGVFFILTTVLGFGLKGLINIEGGAPGRLYCNRLGEPCSSCCADDPMRL